MSQTTFVATLSLILTALVFWALLAPSMEFNLLSYPNLVQHLFGPILVIADRLLFYVGSAPSGREILIALVHPVLYVITVMAVGIAGVMEFPTGRFPYPFLDVYKHGAMVLVYIASLTIGIIIVASLWARMERGLAHRMVMRTLTRRI